MLSVSLRGRGHIGDTGEVHLPDPSAQPRATRSPRARRRAIVGLGCRVVAALLGLSLVTICAFAALYVLAHHIAPSWAYLGSLYEQDADQPESVLMFSLYVYFHTVTPNLVAPHGADRVLVGAEFALSWAWLVLLGAWAVARWHTITDA